MATALPAKQEVVDTSEDPDVGANDAGSEPGSARLDATKALYVGSLHAQVNEAMLESIFTTLGPVAEVKIIKDRITGASAGYGFVKFQDHRAAELAMQSLNGRLLYGQEVRVNWAFQKDQREDTSNHYHIFVGDLGSEVTDSILFEAFQEFPSCSDARVMWDHVTSRSKSYGFVSFRDKGDAEAGIEAMHGQVLGSRRIRCGWAQHKHDDPPPLDYNTVDHADPANSNVYVGSLSADVSELELKRQFGAFGPINEVKCYNKGNYAFVSFAKHADAVRAIVEMNGQKMGGRQLRCSWGRHHQQRQQQQQQQQQLATASMGLMQVHPQLTMQMGLQGMQPMGLVGLPAQWGPHMQAAAAAGYSLPSLAAAAAAMQSMYGPPSPQQQQQLMLSMAGGMPGGLHPMGMAQPSGIPQMHGGGGALPQQLLLQQQALQAQQRHVLPQLGGQGVSWPSAAGQGPSGHVQRPLQSNSKQQFPQQSSHLPEQTAATFAYGMYPSGSM